MVLSFRQRYLLVLSLFLSHLAVGLLFVYFTVSSDAFTYYAILETWSDKDKENFQSFMDLPTLGSIKATINNHPHLITNDGNNSNNNKTVFLITPTYTRPTQKVDLLTLCQTLTFTNTKVVWIVIEDSTEVTQLVTNILNQCPIKSVHLAIKSIERKRLRLHRRLVNKKKTHHRGVSQRNLGLLWLRNNYSMQNCSMGVVYFADDDNRYDRRLFDIMSQTVKVSVWPVGFAGGLKYEGPVCYNNTVYKWRTWEVFYSPKRKFPIDMAGFSVGLCEFFKHPRARFNSLWKEGKLETNFIRQFIKYREQVECRGSDKMVYAWHVKTSQPNVASNKIFLEV